MNTRVAGVVVLAVAGCAYSTPPATVPASVPPIVVREKDVQIEVFGHGMPAESDTWTATYREWTSDILTNARRAPGSALRPVPARVTLRIDVQDEFYWMKACPVVCLVPAIAGTESGEVTLTVDLTVETPGGRYVGGGHATRWGSLYAPAFKRALAVALDRALATAGPAR